jgi:hypothetical protein
MNFSDFRIFFYSRKCELCNENLSKYKCPRCFVETCSLQCVKQHKIDNNCSGVRDQAAFVDMKKFNDRHLLNGLYEYRFLHDHKKFATMLYMYYGSIAHPSFSGVSKIFPHFTLKSAKREVKSPCFY